MFQFHRLALIIVIGLLALASSPGGLQAQSAAESSATDRSVAVTSSTCSERCSRQGRWFIVETDNFQACSQESESSARLLAQSAEKLRTKLETKWLGDDSPAPWKVKCQIVLHPSLASYVAACGRGSEHTVGTSMLNVEELRICSRKIDLLGGRVNFLTAALPHELTHVVLRDRFPNGLPRWADEGMAMLADTDAKQQLHERDLNAGLANRTAFDAAALFALQDYPGSDRMGVFYGQSVSVVKFLVDKGKPKQFVDFVERSTTDGYDAALRDCYGLQNVRQLDRVWSSQFALASASRPAAKRGG